MTTTKEVSDKGASRRHDGGGKGRKGKARDDEAPQGKSLGEHLEDLRGAVLRCVIVPIVLIICIWPFWETIVETIARHLLDEKHIHMLARTTLLDSFGLSVKIAIYFGVVLSIPWVILNLWLFIRPGLYPRERRFGYIAIPASIGLFVGGVTFCYFAVLPATIHFLVDFGADVVGQQLIQIDSFFSLVFSMLFVCGLAFQIPLIVAPAVRFGIVPREFITRHRRALIFISAVLGAVLTPTGDPLTMTLVAAPIYLLVEGGVLLGVVWKHFADRRRAREEPTSLADAFRQGMSDGQDDPDDDPDGPGGSGPNNQPPPRGDVPRSGGEQPLTGSASQAQQPSGADGQESAASAFAATVRDIAGSLGRTMGEGVRALNEDSDDGPQPIKRDPHSAAMTVPLAASVAPVVPASETAVAHKVAEPSTVPAVSGTPEKVAAATSTQSTGRGVNLDAPAAALPAQCPAPAVPALPSELRRRIDHYIRGRLEEILDEAQQTRDNQPLPGADGKNPAADSKTTGDSP